ncbi:hypothetical protein Acr_25g0004220 [Actinidia rufa]|uniref:Uncharacterized protein n=1 Tax=Actinidia rufa TaxID=165716 RepID=A0A7J0GYW3_9ERIC|nr:hypothetical protein Acr_25g0004220 [Actinidia rufa]
MEILSTLPRPRARRRQYFNSDQLNEYSDGGSGELSGDCLARFRGLVLPRSRGFEDKVWRSKMRRWDFVGWMSGDVQSPLGRVQDFEEILERRIRKVEGLGDGYRVLKWPPEFLLSLILNGHVE